MFSLQPSGAHGRRPALIALISGVCGLGSETLFLKLLDETIGSAPIVSFVVIAMFVLGMGLGAVCAGRIRRPWRVEALLLAYNLGWLLRFDQILAGNAQLIAAMSPRLGPTLSAAVLGVAYVLPPAFLLGITFPVAVEREGSVARPYLLQALGALAALLLIEAVGFPRFGLRACLAMICVAHAAQLLLLFGRTFRLEPLPFLRLPPLLILVGGATGAFQGVWLLLSHLLFRPLYFVHPIVVATMIFGLALGSALWLRARWPFARVLSLVLGGVLCSSCAVVLALHSQRPQTLWPIGVQLPLLILPAAVPIGALLPAFFVDRAATRAEAGAALLALSIGNALGALLVSVVLTRWLPPFWSLVAIAALLCAVRLRQAPRTIAAPLVVLILAGLAPAAGDLAFIGRLPLELGRPEKIEALFRGPGEISAIYVTTTGQRRIYQSGYSPIALGGGVESVIGIVGAAYSPRRDRALVLGAGSGRSAGTVAKIFASVDVVDVGATVPALIEALPDESFGLLHLANVRYHAFDAILAPAVLPGGYDLIVMTTDPCQVALATKLYTIENLRRLRRLLRPGGVLVSWSDGELGAEANQVLINGGQAVFAHQKLFSVLADRQTTLEYYLLIDSDDALVFRPPPASWAALFPDAKVAARLMPTTEARHLLSGRVHPTRALHALDRPAASLLRGLDRWTAIPLVPDPAP